MTSVARRPAPYTSPVLAAAPTGVEATDTENIQKAYESLSKGGTLQLRSGTYAVEPGGLKLNKANTWLRGQGGVGYFAELGKILTAGTLITCSSKTGVGLTVEAEGVELSDFGLANNYTSERATLTETLSTAGTITKFKCTALTEAIPNETAVRLLEGAHEQFFRTTAEAVGGATEVKVEALKPNFAYPTTTTKVIIETPTAGSGLATTGGERGQLRCDKVAIEGFFVNVDHAAGLVPTYTNCQFLAGVEYNFRYRNASQPLGGDLTILGCYFLQFKKRKLKAQFRVESASGYKITGNKFNGEGVSATSPEWALDFNNQTTTGIGIAQITGNSIENWKNCIRVTGIAKGECTNFAIVGNEMVTIATAKAVCLEVTHSEIRKAGGLVLVGNSINTEKGTVAKLNNSLKVRIGNNSTQTAEALFKLEGANEGLQIGSASEPVVLPAVVEAAKFYTPAEENGGGPTGNRDCLVQLTIEPKVGQLVSAEIGFKAGFGAEVIIAEPKFLKSAEAQTQTLSFVVLGTNQTFTGAEAGPGKWKIVFKEGEATAMRSVYTYLN